MTVGAASGRSAIDRRARARAQVRGRRRRRRRASSYSADNVAGFDGRAVARRSTSSISTSTRTAARWPDAGYGRSAAPVDRRTLVTVKGVAPLDRQRQPTQRAPRPAGARGSRRPASCDPGALAGERGARADRGDGRRRAPAHALRRRPAARGARAARRRRASSRRCRSTRPACAASVATLGSFVDRSRSRPARRTPAATRRILGVDRRRPRASRRAARRGTLQGAARAGDGRSVERARARRCGRRASRASRRTSRSPRPAARCCACTCCGCSPPSRACAPAKTARPSTRCASRRGGCAPRGACSTAPIGRVSRSATSTSCATWPARSGAVRDIDVQLERLDDYVKELADEQRRGAAAARDELDAATCRGARRPARPALVDRPTTISSPTTAPSSTRPAPGAVDDAGERVRDVAAGRIWRAYEQLRAHETIVPYADVPTLHAVRIDGKRLRYTLEFFREILPAISGLADRRRDGAAGHPRHAQRLADRGRHHAAPGCSSRPVR